MIDYAAARTVALVVQTGSFEKAARALRITPSAVSQRVRQLEERIGAPLIERGTPCTATESGAWLCQHMSHVGMLEMNLLTNLPALGNGQPMSATLDIATNADSLGTWFLKGVSAFTGQSDILLNIAVDDQDHTAECLRRGKVVAAVTSMAEPVAGCQVKALGRLRYVATASPQFISRYFPDGVNAEALTQAPALTFNQKDGLQQEWIAKTFGTTIVHPSHWLPSTQGFVDAGLLGIGWSLNPVQLAHEYLADGRLVELVPGAVLDVALYWQVTRLMAEPLAQLTRAVVQAGERELLPL